MVIDEQTLAQLDAEQLRQMTQRLLGELRYQRALNEKLSYECALLKRMKFAAQSERFDAEQRLPSAGDQVWLQVLGEHTCYYQNEELLP